MKYFFTLLLLGFISLNISAFYGEELEKTDLGQAVINGNIEKYKSALIALKEKPGINLQQIVEMKTTDGKNLLELMLYTKKKIDISLSMK